MSEDTRDTELQPIEDVKKEIIGPQPTRIRVSYNRQVGKKSNICKTGNRQTSGFKERWDSEETHGGVTLEIAQDLEDGKDPS